MTCNSKKSGEILFCAAPAPLLWKGLFYFIPLLAIALIGIAIHIAIAAYKKRKAGKKILDKKMKTSLVYFSVIFLSLMTYGIVGLDFNFYLLVFFMLALYVVGAFFAGEYFKLFKVRREFWVAFAAAALIFATFFLVCFVSSVRENEAFKKGTQVDCLNRMLF